MQQKNTLLSPLILEHGDKYIINEPIPVEATTVEEVRAKMSQRGSG